MAPPGPIPNPEVKHRRVDGSRTIGPARVDRCQDSTTPVGESQQGLTAFGALPVFLGFFLHFFYKILLSNS